ncbi:MAG: hypothetical protein K8R35_08880, partial [Bacteroidales bacterium]|nr:hypothetical protein [Bacteroidales bacterium]
MKTRGLILILLLVAGQYTMAQNPEISGFVRNYTGVLYDNGDFSILQNTLNLNFTKSGDKIAFKANPLV